ncbi:MULTISPECIES: MFS transporter [unclassified Streptomyces]|uniref:MFS transporter n=1 Tax=unclassified Streptomyces TaxID=2593676 RepID=UPI00278C753B|nr:MULTISPECIES: MFS transporter [unclassified Streptomyces]
MTHGPGTRPRGTFRSLRVRNFRLFALGQVASVTGTWMMVTAQDWLVLRLTDDSAGALGLVTALQFAPVMLLTMLGGRLADRCDKRKLLMAANAVSAAFALLLTVSVATGVVRLWHVAAAAAALGTVNAVEIPTRMSFVGELVGPRLLPNASALSAAYFNTARVLGPALAGLLLSTVGTPAVMLLNAVSYLATLAGLALIRPAELRHRASLPGKARVADGLRYVAARSDLVMPLLLTAVVCLAGFNFQLTLPLLAKTTFHTEAATFGLLTTALAVGSLAAALVTTARRGRPAARTVVVAAVAFGALELLAGFAPGLPSAAVALGLTGFAMLYFSQAANHRIQLGTPPEYRGRVLAMYTLITQGSTPVGALLTGLLIDRFGARAGLSAGGLISLAAALAALLWLKSAAPPLPAEPAAAPPARTRPSVNPPEDKPENKEDIAA